MEYILAAWVHIFGEKFIYFIILQCLPQWISYLMNWGPGATEGPRSLLYFLYPFSLDFWQPGAPGVAVP